MITDIVNFCGIAGFILTIFTVVNGNRIANYFDTRRSERSAESAAKKARLDSAFREEVELAVRNDKFFILRIEVFNTRISQLRNIQAFILVAIIVGSLSLSSLLMKRFASSPGSQQLISPSVSSIVIFAMMCFLIFWSAFYAFLIMRLESDRGKFIFGVLGELTKEQD